MVLPTTRANAVPLRAMGTLPRSAIGSVWAATLVSGAACWVFAVREMRGMDMGVATRLGSFTFFAAAWLLMMSAMMLPAVTPAVLRHARESGRVRVVPTFVALYLAVWALVGAAVYALYRPHGPVAAGAVAIAAGLYELTPIKRYFRGRCLERAGSGLEFGLCCVGSSIGLVLMMVALGVMSVTWMAVVAVIGLVQKLVPARANIDVPLGLAIVGLGALVMAVPTALPGLTPT
jgi:predicted metal-binding membrane protein